MVGIGLPITGRTTNYLTNFGFWLTQKKLSKVGYAMQTWKEANSCETNSRYLVVNLPPFYPVFALDTKDNCQHGVD